MAVTIARRVLIVDDNLDSAELTGEIIASFGHEVQTANDGPQALKMLETFAADVAILDLNLPEMTGYELATLIRSARKDTRLIALSGRGQAEDRQKSHDAGFALHLVKPVEIATLEASIGDPESKRPGSQL